MIKGGGKRTLLPNARLRCAAPQADCIDVRRYVSRGVRLRQGYTDVFLILMRGRTLCFRCCAWAQVGSSGPLRAI